jgi:hypothetical protein
MIISDQATHEQPPFDTHPAVCVSVIDIGTQRREYKGVVKMLRRVRIGFQLPDCLRTIGEHAGKPFLMTEFYTTSLSEKATLCTILESWRGRKFTEEEKRGFDLKNLLGAPCMLQVIEGNTGKAHIGGVTKMYKGLPTPQMVGGTQYLSLDNFDRAVFEGLSDGIKAMIEASPEYQRLDDVEQAFG